MTRSPDPRPVTVVLGDPRLPDATKVDGRYSPEDLEALERLRAALAELEGYAFRYLDDHGRLVDDLRRERPDFVLNFCDTGFANEQHHELHVPALLELLGISYSGTGPAGLALCYDKALVRAVAAAHGVPVPDEVFVAGCDPAAPLPVSYPALVKPATGDGSLGISQDAVVRDADEAHAGLARLRAALPGRDALVQEFLPGAEYGLALIGNPEHGFTLLPPMEVDYSELDPSLPRILGYESKTLPESPYWTQIRYREARLDAEVRERLAGYARLLFARLRCRDYARFDFRSDARGQIVLLEVNPNPAWCWDGKLNFMAGFAGLGYAELLGRILEAGLRRVAS